MNLDFLSVILVNTRFPENIGMVARACANMGCNKIILVNPERWQREKAEPLATSKGLCVLDKIEICPNLETALAPHSWAVATTARLGGWRRSVLHPEQAAQKLMLYRTEKAALVMGPEDRGLNNAEISQCSAIAHIPTDGASSLNLAQATLLMLYEFQKQARLEGKTPAKSAITAIDHASAMRLEESFRDILLLLDCIPQQNPDYFFGKWQQILRRAPLKQHEFDCLMGFCRQIKNKIVK